MSIRKNNYYVITGGPGVGKTTLIEHLQKSGFTVVSEVARDIIKQQHKFDGQALPWKNKSAFFQLMLDASVQSFKALQDDSSTIYFFDRGIVDAICYAKMIAEEITDDLERITRNHLYNQTVFILPPWPEIYQTDQERKQSWEEAVYTYEQMKASYLNYGYDLVEVPTVTVEARVQFILEQLSLIREIL